MVQETFNGIVALRTFGSYVVGSMLDVIEFVWRLVSYPFKRIWYGLTPDLPEQDRRSLTREQRRRLDDLGDPEGKYADDDPRKYGLYNLGTTGYIGPSDKTYLAEEEEEDGPTSLGIRYDRRDISGPYSHAFRAPVTNPSDLVENYKPPRKSIFRRRLHP